MKTAFWALLYLGCMLILCAKAITAIIDIESHMIPRLIVESLGELFLWLGIWFGTVYMLFGVNEQK